MTTIPAICTHTAGLDIGIALLAMLCIAGPAVAADSPAEASGEVICRRAVGVARRELHSARRALEGPCDLHREPGGPQPRDASSSFASRRRAVASSRPSASRRRVAKARSSSLMPSEARRTA